jgi:dCMP deaminase
MSEKWDKRFLGLAQHVSAWSKDPSTKVGAVVVDQHHRVISLGFNGFARGVVDSEERLNDRETKYKMVVHAESNALLFAKMDMWDATIYVWPFMPCAACAAKIIQAGIKRVVAPEASPELKERWGTDMKLTEQMFKEVGIIFDVIK